MDVSCVYRMDVSCVCRMNVSCVYRMNVSGTPRDVSPLPRILFIALFPVIAAPMSQTSKHKPQTMLDTVMVRGCVVGCVVGCGVGCVVGCGVGEGCAVEGVVVVM